MAITILSQPYKVHSGYNPSIYKVTSTNKLQPGFRYVVELYNSVANTKMAEFSIVPDPTDSNNGWVDVSKILQTKLEGYINTAVDTSVDATTAYHKYNIRFGESLVKNWSFNDFVFLPGNGLGFTTSTVYGAGFSNVDHNLVVGDQIEVKTTSSYTDNRNLLNNYFQVIEVVDSKTVKVNGAFDSIGSFPVTPGIIKPADGSKAITLNLANATATAVNTAMGLKEYQNTGGSLINYELLDATNTALTNQPVKYSITPQQYVYFNSINNASTQRLLFTNSNGETFYKSNLAGTDLVRSIGVGAGNLGTLTPISGTLPLIKSDTDWYTVQYTSTAGVVKSMEYKFNLDRRCKIDDAQILFMDRKGSYNSFAFQLRKREMISTEKKSYNKYMSTPTTMGRGETVYYSEVEKMLSMTTNYMTEDMNMYFEELMTSRNTYVLYKGLWYACVVTDTSFQNEYTRNNKLIKKTVNVKFAHNNPVN